jgi:hypothetical protein
MATQRPGHGPRRARRLAPHVELLDLRELLSAGGLGPHLGHYVAPAQFPRSPLTFGLRPTAVVDAHAAINRELLSVLGPGMDRIVRGAQLGDSSASSVLSGKVLAQPFVHALLSDNDTYTLLGAPWLSKVFAPQDLQGTDQNQTVTLTLPRAGHQIGLGDPTIIQVNPGDPAPGPPGSTFAFGFVITVPATSVVFTTTQIIVQVPLSQIPTMAQSLSNVNPNNLPSVYGSTGPLLTELFRSGLSQMAPTALPTVPGLRLVNTLDSYHNLPDPNRSRVFYQMRIAANKQLLALNGTQTNLVNKGLSDFLAVVDNWKASSTPQLNQLIATHPGGQLVPTPVRGPLNGTVAVSLGVVQQPNVVQLDSPERVDVGFIFARNGDYGLKLTARGPLSTTLPTAPPNKIAAGDIQTEVSNATNILQLQGWRIVEGVTEGAVLSGGVAATNQDHVATFATSAGYGAGLEFGLGVQYTRIIPLGNVFSGPIP